MRILLDESLPRKLGFLLTGHYVRTVQRNRLDPPYQMSGVIQSDVVQHIT